MKQYTSDYFEGILQVRDGDDELIEWIYKRVEKDNKARIVKQKKTVNGVDIYITDQHYLQNLGRKLKDHFSGVLKVSKRLHTMDKMTSKHLYRVTVLFKKLPFKRGDFILFRGENMQIMSIGDDVELKEIESGRRTKVNLDIFLRARAL